MRSVNCIPCCMDVCEQFVLYKDYPRGGKIWLMLGLDTSGLDYNDLICIAECFAEKGHEVKVLHAVHYKDPIYREVFRELIGTRYYRKCPDLMVDGDLFEYESYVRPWNKRKLSNMLTNGLRQSDKIIIDNREGTGVRQIKRAIQSRLYVNATITEVWMYDGNNVVEVYIKNTGVPEGPLQGGAP